MTPLAQIMLDILPDDSAIILANTDGAGLFCKLRGDDARRVGTIMGLMRETLRQCMNKAEEAVRANGGYSDFIRGVGEGEQTVRDRQDETTGPRWVCLDEEGGEAQSFDDSPKSGSEG